MGFDPFVQQSLLERGINPANFAWHMRVTSMTLASGRRLAGGEFASTDSETLHLFRYSPKEGFQLASFNVDQLVVQASVNDQETTLSFSVSNAPISTFDLRIDRKWVEEAHGPWVDFVKPAFTATLDIDAGAPIAIGSLKLVGPQQNGFGTYVVQETGAAVIHFDKQALCTLPKLKLPDSAFMAGWNTTESRTIISYFGGDRPVLLSIEADSSLRELLEEVLGQLPEDLHDHDLTEDVLGFLGEFVLATANTKDEEALILKRDEKAIVIYGQPDSPTYTYACVLAAADIAILADATGQPLGIRIDSKIAADLFGSLVAAPELMRSESGTQWGLALADTEPVRFAIEADNFDIGGRTIPVSATGNILVKNRTDELSEVTLNWSEDGQPVELTLTMHDTVAFQFWEEWDVKRASAGIAQAGPAELYEQFNQAKKHNMLLVMFGDVLLLNRALDSDITMDDLIAQMQSTGAVKFAEDDKLRDATVTKILLLTSTLTAMKQKFELLGTMAPYYWAQEEAKWLSGVFGAKAVSDCAVEERKRIVPLVRRQIRQSHSDMMRSLAQIEMVARPLEAIFARKEIQKHWSSKVRQFLPAVAQSTIGGAMLLSSGGALGWHMVGGAVATHGLGAVLSVFQRDREAAAEIQHAAETIFPWWQVFMRTLVVSVFEASEFMDQENNRCMIRDKRLLDSTGEQRDDFSARLQQQLRKRILDERRNRFAEIVDGSGIRLAEVVDDIERAIGPEMRDGVENFSQTLVAVGRKHDTKEQKNGPD